ncbi:MAG: cyclic nucleotide-binding domain-containing protein [Balneolales bacterium]
MENNKPKVFDENLHSLLEKTPLLFRRFEPDELRHFLMLGHKETYQTDDILVQESEQSKNTAFLIIEGQVSIWSEEIHLADLSAGDFIGETFLFGNGSRTATGKATRHTIVLRFERDEVLHFFRTMPERLFKVFIMNIIEIQQGKIAVMNTKTVQLKRRLLKNEEE